ncbi:MULTISPECIES: hypothetical protein [unclassified Novosphingobium]|uniref:hypothetical protein n=1 Tax=unclassified Novosphingobium TaxID=2644732 RepID=UPI0014943561|nr:MULTISPECIES: hypothetical protein [unclassified Novosphingobium]MBB3357451.1 hypothetical protein [Novosphingobium sp. BK256]MBB3373887.1 hypothetical protein [Novosphingobium sp. BK280]MBB3378299.1 hypothetical protein [Novosphingobium sp. BK258]MBB3419917.1 hypothetical protein [Novosphingobium sp. BK267]MBB3447762.1 hypothetical protein [Novosphingobium sp. BK352]
MTLRGKTRDGLMNIANMRNIASSRLICPGQAPAFFADIAGSALSSRNILPQAEGNGAGRSLGL